MKKSKVGTFLLFLLAVALIAVLLIFGYIIVVELLGANTVETTQSDNIIAVDDGSGTTTQYRKKSIGESISDIFTSPKTNEVTYSAESSNGKHYYEQLNENQKNIYNGLQENKEKLASGTYSISYGDKFRDTLEKENGSEILGDDYQAAIEAFTHDNPDLFYLDVSKMYLNMETNKKLFTNTYNVYIKPKDEQNYYAKGFTSESQVKTAIQKIEQIGNAIKSKLTNNAHDNIKMIHDYLIENIEYDADYKSVSPYTMYGALIEKRCVCEGYAKAFKYLCNLAGIDCILMQGIATNSDGTTENHAWNAVKLYGVWYLVDTTWDDPIIVGRGLVSKNTYYRYFLKGTNTFNKDHKPETQFTKGGKKFSYPSISAGDY